MRTYQYDIVNYETVKNYSTAMGQDGCYLAGISPAGEIDDAKVAVKI